MTELRRVEAVSSLGHSVTAGTPEHSGTLDDGTFADLSCHRRPWRSHLRSAPCCRSVTQSCVPTVRPAARPRRGHPASAPAPAPERSNERAHHTARQSERAPRLRLLLRGRAAAEQLTGRSSGSPTAGRDLRTIWFRSAADAEEAAASRAAEEPGSPAPDCAGGCCQRFGFPVAVCNQAPSA